MHYPNDISEHTGNGREIIQNGVSSPADFNGRGTNNKVAANVRKSRSFMELSLSSTSSVKTLGRNERRVLVIYTGGTIGMVKNREGGKRPLLRK